MAVGVVTLATIHPVENFMAAEARGGQEGCVIFHFLDGVLIAPIDLPISIKKSGVSSTSALTVAY